jgi:hypothetical protein
MNSQQSTGLGEPDLIGKKNLFQPPSTSKALPAKPETKKKKTIVPRIRMTLEITRQSLAIMQEIQGKYRLKTGRPLPNWKIISAALESYGKNQKGEGSEKHG